MDKELVEQIIRQRFLKISIAVIITIAYPIIGKMSFAIRPELSYVLYLPALIIVSLNYYFYVILIPIMPGSQVNIFKFIVFYALEFLYLYVILTIIEKIILKIKEMRK